MARFSIGSTELPLDPNIFPKKYCRFCGYEKDEVELFDLARKPANRNKYIQRLQYMNINLDFSRNLPTSICATCFAEFCRSFDFIKQFYDAQENLSIIFEDNNGNDVEIPVSSQTDEDEFEQSEEEQNEAKSGVDGDDEGERSSYVEDDSDVDSEGDSHNENEEEYGDYIDENRVENVIREKRITVEDSSGEEEDTEEDSDEVSVSEVDMNHMKEQIDRKEDRNEESDSSGSEENSYEEGIAEYERKYSDVDDAEVERVKDNSNKKGGHYEDSDGSESEENSYEEETTHENENQVTSTSQEGDGIREDNNYDTDTNNNTNNEALDRPDPVSEYQMEENEVGEAQLVKSERIDNAENQPSTSTLDRKRRCDENEEEPPNQRSKIDEDNSMNKSWSSYTWTCCHCDYEYPNLKELRIHSKEAHSICFGFECPECDAEYNTFEEFVEHVRDHRSNLRYYCPVCDKRFKSVTKCNNHYTTHAEACKYCGEILPSPEVVALHYNVYRRRILQTELNYVPLVISVTEHTKEQLFFENVQPSWEDYPWSCGRCGVVGRSMQALRIHGLAEHRNCFTVTCRACNQEPTSFLAFIAHVVTHKPQLKNVCPYCNKKIGTTITLRQHMGQHTNTCSTCGQIFRNDDERSQHYRENEVIEQPNNADLNFLVENIEIEGNKSEFQFKCSSCESSFESEETLMRHKQATQCRVCNLVYNCFLKLRVHMFKTHFAKKPFHCLKCNRSFLSAITSKIHSMCHENEVLETCEICRATLTKLFFKQHIKLHDINVQVMRTIPCKHCPHTFSSYADVVNHFQKVHGKLMYEPKVIIANWIKTPK